jgi:flagellar FliL protein
MAEEKENQSQEEEKEEKSGGGNKLLLIVIIVLLLLLLIIGGLVAYFLLSNNNSDDNQAQPQKQEKVVKKKKASDMAEVGPIYPLDQFIVNLVSNNADRYLKCKISFELDSPDLQQEIDKKLPAVRDIVINILSSKTVEEIQTAKGKEKLKEEIRRKVNEILTTGEIRHVYFTEFVIQ